MSAEWRVALVAAGTAIQSGDMDLDPTPVELRNDIAAAGDLRDRLRAAVSAGAAATPSASWGEREQQALDALRAMAVFLHHHANTEVARAITRELGASA